MGVTWQADPMFERIRAAYFDLDGTLADTVDLILAGHAHAFHEQLGTRGPPRERVIGNMGRSLSQAIREYVAEDGCEDVEGVAEAILTTYRAFQWEHHQGLTRAYPGVRAVVDTLSAAGTVLAVVTSKVEWMARLTLADVGLDGSLPVGVFHDDTARHKPDPAPLLLAAERTGISPAETVYIGDSVHDVAAGRAAGMKTIAAGWGPFERADLEAARPDAIAARPLDLLDLIPGERETRRRPVGFA